MAYIQGFAIVKTSGVQNLDKLEPATVPMQNDPKQGLGKGEQLRALSPWWHYMENPYINSPKGYEYTRKVGAMWINSGYDIDTPYSTARPECIINAGNYVAYDAVERDHIRILSFDCFEDPFASFTPESVNWRSRPHLFFKATATNNTGKIWNVSNELDIYFPIMRRADKGYYNWLPLSRVELFQAVPFTLSIPLWVGAIRIRRGPGITYDMIDGDYFYQRYFPGQTPTILAYRLVGQSVWGMTDKGWICLLLSEVPAQRTFLTSWKLSTPGVVPPQAWPPAPTTR